MLQAISSVHAGSGSEIGIVDLPIQREQHTGIPKIESSTLKGAIKADFELNQILQEETDFKEKMKWTFGSDPQQKEDKENKTVAGAISYADARLLFFPVKSMKGVFALVTCPEVLNRFVREMSQFQDDIKIQSPIEEGWNGCKVCEKSSLTMGDKSSKDSENSGKKNIVLEQYAFPVEQNLELDAWVKSLANCLYFSDENDKSDKDNPNNENKKIFVNRLTEKLVILDDQAFMDFVKLSTEVNARIKIDSKTGVVNDGGLWYEENLPPESILYSFLFVGDARGKGLEDFEKADHIKNFLDKRNEIFQLGGNSTLGRGLLKYMEMKGVENVGGNN